MTAKYDALYENMKNRFTVESDGSEYTLGEYMLMKASKKDSSARSLPVAVRNSRKTGDSAVLALVSYVNDKLTVKEPPVKDKTIRAFPFRASMSAFLSAAVACSFLLCFSVIGARIFNLAAPEESEASITEYAPEIELQNSESGEYDFI
ncbi:MAG: hypothetical protein IJ488_01275 [Clostridia bacterium]|nr:hypothetical protein [Clostridia bacterium]